tara:strand:- start:56 stop:601 length:546 start_codon:yes stop_codon:yes gene_type:complete
MINDLIDFQETISVLDIIFMLIVITSAIKSYSQGFILSLLSASKWLLAYVVTLILFPKAKPYFKDMIDSEYVLDVSLGFFIFILVLFIILIINRGLSKTVRFLGLGRLDSIFGLFFGFIKGYLICVILFSAVDIVYNYKKWPTNIDISYAFPYVKKGSNYLIKEFPNEKTYKNSREKIKDL